MLAWTIVVAGAAACESKQPQQTPPAQLGEVQPQAPRVILMAADSFHLTPGDTLHGDMCKAGDSVVVMVEIQGGAPGNAVQGSATCSGVQVVSDVNTAVSGDSAARGIRRGTQGIGRSGCYWATTMADPSKPSHWKVTCSFF
jgi:hypothetical protein